MNPKPLATDIMIEFQKDGTYIVSWVDSDDTYQEQDFLSLENANAFYTNLKYWATERIGHEMDSPLPDLDNDF